MENNTGFEVGDHVVISGGFEDGIVGTISEIDLSGSIRNHPRFTVDAQGGRATAPIRGLNAINLIPLTADWREDTGYWDDGARSWVAEVAAQEWGPTKTGRTTMCTARIRDESTSTRDTGDHFTWSVVRSDGTSADRGMAPSLDWAKLHALKAVVWHGVKKGGFVE
jgi:hypothetical protein